MQAAESVRALEGLRRRRVVRAQAGQHGGRARRGGRNGQDAVVIVPVGTLVWGIDGVQELLADLDAVGKEVIVAGGGRGGRGNARLATATRQAPRIAERGLPGEERRIRLELRLLAEAGLVGLPNAGKSALLRTVSKARPKVAAYAFTTLEPYLGMAEVAYETVVLADIPGLIEGAHRGAGLGIDFLRHIRRTRVLVNVVDGAARDPIRDIEVVRSELEAFGHGLKEKRWLVALNKIDLPEARENEPRVTETLSAQGIEVHRISALTGEGTAKLMNRLLTLVREESRTQEMHPHRPTAVLPMKRRRFEVVRVGDKWEVRGEMPARIVEVLGVESEEARAEVLRRLKRIGVSTALRRAGAQPYARIVVGGVELEWPG